MKRLLGVAILLTAIIVPSVLLATQGERAAEVRIVARALDDGRIEFGLQKLDGDGWSETILPRGRYFPANARRDRWLTSSPVSVPPFVPIQATTYGNDWTVVRDLGLGEVAYQAWYPEPIGNFSTGVTLRASREESDRGVRAVFVLGCGEQVGSVRSQFYAPASFRAFVSFAGVTPRQVEIPPEAEVYGDPYAGRRAPESSYIFLRGTKYVDGAAVHTDWWVNTLELHWMYDELRDLDELYVGIVGYASGSNTSEVFKAWFTNFGDVFETLVQPNIDRCGEY